MAAVKQKRRRRETTEVKPLLLKPRMAAERLSLAYETVTRMVADGTFSAFAPGGRGVGKRYWLFADEIDAYVTAGGDVEVLKNFRRKKGRLAQ